jgi:hypothetical protein
MAWYLPNRQIFSVGLFPSRYFLTIVLYGLEINQPLIANTVKTRSVKLEMNP